MTVQKTRYYIALDNIRYFIYTLAEVAMDKKCNYH